MTLEQEDAALSLNTSSLRQKMDPVPYETFLPQASSGLVFLKLGYPVSRLRSVITKTSFTHVGFYMASAEAGPTGVLINLIDVYTGALTPSWYREGFMLEDLLGDRLTEAIVIKPYKGDPRKFREAVLALVPSIPQYTLEQTLREAFALDSGLLRDTDLLLSFIASLEGGPLEVKRREAVATAEELTCETKMFATSHQLAFTSAPEAALIAETESALFLEKSLFQRLAQALLKLIAEDASFRRDVARNILLPSDDHILSQLHQVLGEEHQLWQQLLACWDKGFVTGELHKSQLRDLLSAIGSRRQELARFFPGTPVLPTLEHLPVATSLTFDEVSNTRETNLYYLHELVQDIAQQCRDGVTHVTIPLNTLITATNRLGLGLTDLPPIAPVERGSYGALLLTSPEDEVTLEQFTLKSGNIQLIPSHNAHLEGLTLEQLQELNQLLNTRRHSRIVGEKFHQLREKVARTIARRRAEQEAKD